LSIARVAGNLQTREYRNLDQIQNEREHDRGRKHAGNEPERERHDKCQCSESFGSEMHAKFADRQVAGAEGQQADPQTPWTSCGGAASTSRPKT
jgi:hypothetical protein